MNILTSLKRKTTQSFLASIIIISALAGMQNACSIIIETPKPTDVEGMELTPTVQNPATQELTLVSPTEVATETAPAELIKINMDNIIYPPVGYVKENFEKGEYDAGLETIKQWVSVWKKKGVFEGLEIENDGLSPVPLDGRARIVCVDTEKKGTGTLICPPLDLVNGGLKAVPVEGEWDETDKPLLSTFQGTEELVTKGNGIDLAYQFVDKYQKSPIKYIDPKTGQSVEGEYQVPGGEIKLPEIVPESMNQIEELSFNMEFKDPKAAYRMLLERVVGNNLENQQYWQEILGTSNPTVDQLLSYARNNVGGPENKAYWLPFITSNDTKFNFMSWWGYSSDPRMLNPEMNGIYLDGIYNVFYYGEDFKKAAEADFINGIKRDNKNILMGLDLLELEGIAGEEFGLLFFNNRFIYISGSEGLIGLPSYGEYLLGGKDKTFRPDRDPAIVSAQFLSYIKALSNINSRGSNSGGLICTYGDISDCPGGVLSNSLSQGDWVVKAK